MRRYNLSDAIAYLLEKAGDIQGAFGIMRESLQAKIKSIEESSNQQGDEGSQQGTRISALLTRGHLLYHAEWFFISSILSQFQNLISQIFTTFQNL